VTDFAIFLTPPRQMPGYHLQLSYGGFIIRPFYILPNSLSTDNPRLWIIERATNILCLKLRTQTCYSFHFQITNQVTQFRRIANNSLQLQDTCQEPTCPTAPWVITEGLKGGMRGEGKTSCQQDGHQYWH